MTRHPIGRCIHPAAYNPDDAVDDEIHMRDRREPEEPKPKQIDSGDPLNVKPSVPMFSWSRRERE